MTDNNRTLSINDELKLPIGNISRSYLVKFVDPEKEYDVDYIIKQDGSKENGVFTLKGNDLTETQILQLFLRESL